MCIEGIVILSLFGLITDFISRYKKNVIRLQEETSSQISKTPSKKLYWYNVIVTVDDGPKGINEKSQW